MKALGLLLSGLTLVNFLSNTLHADTDSLGPASGLIEKGTYGPWQYDPTAPPPKHAYSPFDPRFQKPEVRPLVEGVDYDKEKLVIKFKPDSKPDRGAFAPAGAYRGGQAFAQLGIKNLKPVFPESAAEWAGKPGPDGRPYPDLTLWYTAEWNQNMVIEEAIALLKQDPAVAYAEPTVLRKLAIEQSTLDVQPPEQPASNQAFQPRNLPSSTSDPLYDQSWHLDAIGVQEGWQYLEDQGLPPGGSRDIVVAVIDTGVDYNHPDLVANMWINSGEIPNNGQDDDNNGFVDDIHGVAVVSDSRFESGDPNDDHGHGTHVAGIIAMQANNGIGGTGVAYNAQIMAIKAAQYSGLLSATDVSQAIYYAVEKGADVINMSFGGYNNSQIEEDALAVAFGQAVLVAAAGNDGIPNEGVCSGEPMYPAAHNWIIGVMAGTTVGGLASFSNKECIPHNRIEYEIILPGVDIMSTLPGDQYAAWDGTSMAAPVASGMAVLLRSKWADKDIYSSRFIMGQLVANNGNLLAALTKAPEPELRYLEHWLFDREQEAAGNDGDGIVDNGETVELAIVIRNHWGRAENVTLKLEAQASGAFQPDPYVTFEVDEVNLGAVGSFNWKDNGLIYDDQGVITGVRTPFRFSVASNTPNDHLIPFKLTMTCESGHELDDPNAPYVFESRFSLFVQNGRTLPRIIENDITLTSDHYWIFDKVTKIEENVTLTIEAGTQIAIGPSEPPRDTDYNFEGSVSGGTIIAKGDIDNLIEIFPTYQATMPSFSLYSGKPNSIIQYARLLDATVNLATVDRCEFRLSGIGGKIYRKKNSSANSFQQLTESIMEDPNLGGGGYGNNKILNSNIFILRYKDIMYLSIDEIKTSNYNVFLNSYSLLKSGVKGGDYGVNIRPLIEREMSPELGGDEIITVLSTFQYNSILNPLWSPDSDKSFGDYYRVWPDHELSRYGNIGNNYWGTTSPDLMDIIIYDYYDDWSRPKIDYQPILEIPSELAWPHVYKVEINGTDSNSVPAVNNGICQFKVFFNRDMDTSIQPFVKFGPAEPFSDFVLTPTNNGWINEREWIGSFNITSTTGNGYQMVSISNGSAKNDPWLALQPDLGRFRFEITSSGVKALTLQSTGGEGFIDLSWVQDDFDLMAGFNLYRSQSAEGNFQRINQNLLSPTTKDFRDTNVAPGETYYYKFTVVKTDFTESDYSNVSESTPLDTIPPNISHSEIHSASPGLPVTLTADATDNVQVVSVKLFYRSIGDSEFKIAPMTRTVNNRYAATLEGSKLKSPGLEYYMVVFDGISNAFAGRAEFPITIQVIDEPVVSGINPNTGPASGGTAVTLIGSNFKDGATVNFNGVEANDVVWVNASQITCTTPDQVPLAADVRVVNPDGSVGVLANAFHYFSNEAQISMPDTGGGRESVVSIPVGISNAQDLVGIDITISYDLEVLQCLTVASGDLLAGWNLASNINTPGQIRLSAVSTRDPVSGSGELVVCEFSVIGANGANSALTLSQATLNDGAIATTLANGSFTIDSVYDVGGTVRFWKDSRPVSSVSFKLEGEQNFTGASSQDGSYVVNGTIAGSYQLRPSKSDQSSSISPYDAALVLQHAVGLTTLSGGALTAADVNKNGTINSIDAYHILQYSVGLTQLPFSGAVVVWDFDPQTRSVQIQQSHLTNIDFTAILIGDVSGNWPDEPASQTLSLSEANTAIAALEQVDMVAKAPGLLGTMSRELNQPRISNSPYKLAWRSVDGTNTGEKAFMLFTQTSEPGLVSVDAELEYPGVRTIQAGTLSESMFMAQGTPDSDQAHVGLATSAPVTGSGSLLTVYSDQASMEFPTIDRLAINDGYNAIMWDQNGSWMEEDIDGDGHSFWQEVVAGTDPEDATSVFRILPFQATDGNVIQLTWSSVDGKEYLVERMDQTTADSWHAVGDIIEATDASTSLNVPLAGSENIYRVRVLP